MAKPKFEIVLVAGKHVCPELDGKGNPVMVKVEGMDRVKKQYIKPGESFLTNEPLHRIEPRRYRLKGGGDQDSVDMKAVEAKAMEEAEKKLQIKLEDKDRRIAELEAQIENQDAMSKLVEEQKKVAQEAKAVEEETNKKAAAKKKTTATKTTTRKRSRGE
jgi:hypothetical protein